MNHLQNLKDAPAPIARQVRQLVEAGFGVHVLTP